MQQTVECQEVKAKERVLAKYSVGESDKQYSSTGGENK
jgi:hypothetical protein